MGEAFERLIHGHRSEIYRTILRQSRNREDAEDLTQITFLNAYAALRRGAEPEEPRAWLHAIARNAASRRFRQSRVDVELDAEAAAPLDEDIPTLQELRTALACLTFNQRASLLMREVGGLSAAEIGARLGVSPGAVATLLFRARRAFRAELETAGFRGAGKRSRLGSVSVLCASATRWGWFRLSGPAFDGTETLLRSAAVAGVASAAAAVAVFTSTLPVSAAASHLRVGRAVSPASAAPRVHDTSRWTAARTRVRLADPRVSAVSAATRPVHNPARAPSPRVGRFDSAATASAPPEGRGIAEVPPPAPRPVGEPPPEQSDGLVHRLVPAAPQRVPARLAQLLGQADPIVDVRLPVSAPDPPVLPPAASADLSAVSTLAPALPPDTTPVSPPAVQPPPLPAQPASPAP